MSSNRGQAPDGTTWEPQRDTEALIAKQTAALAAERARVVGPRPSPLAADAPATPPAGPPPDRNDARDAERQRVFDGVAAASRQRGGG